PYGDVFCRPGLADKQRQLSIIAALAALGYAAPELRVHIHGALNVGASREEIIETMVLMSVYAGFPASIHGIRAAEAVFAQRDAEAGGTAN
ncbi:MAG: carboxymuconolactone decarboxylase family protein, partial [Kiloniellales bacterium]|nr:carboxymuconolactone decarboxylase family protein [Kiloniellales bacterium]